MDQTGPMRTLWTLAALSSLVLASCASAPHRQDGTPAYDLVRKVSERPMSGKKASEPIADSLSRITNKTSGNHLGTDFTARKQPLPIFAAKEGQVLSNTTALSSSGSNTITVLNSDGSVSRYLHVGSDVRPGDALTMGESLGTVLLPGQPGYGTTNTGPHLHYEQFLDKASFDKRKAMTTQEVISQWAE